MQKTQTQLLQLMFEFAWQIPPCIKRMQRLSLYDNVRLLAYRVIAQFYSWIKAGPAQIWHQIQDSDRRNPINDYHKLKAIVTFANENTMFTGCEHPLLQRCCPGGMCLITELMNEHKSPCLFQQR